MLTPISLGALNEGAEGDAQMASSVITAMTLQGLFAQQQQSAVGPNSRVIQLTTTTPAVTVGQGGAPHLGRIKHATNRTLRVA